MPKLTPKVRQRIKKNSARLDRLARPSLPKSIGGLLTEGAETADESMVKAVFSDLLNYGDPNRSYRAANQHYYAALGKVYAVWLRIGRWPEKWRRDLLAQIDSQNRSQSPEGKGRTSRGTDLHVLLRLLIRHEGGARAEQRLRTRDVGALRQAARLGWSPAELAEGFAKGNAGLYSLYLDDIAARKAERLANIDPVEAGAPKVPRSAQTAAADTPTPAKLDDSYRLKWGAKLKKIIRGKVVTGREIVVRIRVDSYDRRLDVIDAWQGTAPKIDDSAWQMAMDALGTRPLGGGRKRPKV